MPKGENPNSHNNKPAIKNGLRKSVLMPIEFWDYVRELGDGNENAGLRRLVKMMMELEDKP